MPRFRFGASCICMTVLLAGCAGWWPLEPQHPAALRPGDILEFHARGQAVRLHAVRFAHDSLSGVPWLQPKECDSCRVQYAVDEAADARIGHPETTGWVLFILPFVLLFEVRHAFAGLNT